MTFCEISNSKGSGLSVGDGGVITIIDANPFSTHHNCTSFGNFNAVYNYGKGCPLKKIDHCNKQRGWSKLWWFR
jgi:hypothetical protein